MSISILYAVLVFAGGLIAGSFLNVVIHRGPVIWKLVERDTGHDPYSLMAPRSHCPQCRTQIKTVHLVPVIGFLLLRGKCADCGARISWRYPIVELLAGLAALTAFSMAGSLWVAAALFIFSCFLIPLAFIDFETTFLPDALNYPFLAAGLLANIPGLIVGFADAAIGAIVGFLIFWLIGAVFYRLRGKDGLGLGDAKLLAGIGAWLGWMALPFIVLISSLLGLAVLLVLQVSGKELTRDTAIPFGPFLAVGAAAIVLLHLAGLPLLI